MSARSKHALIQLGSEGSEQLPFAKGPLRWTPEQKMAKFAEGLTEVLRSIHKGLDDVGGLAAKYGPDQAQH